MSKLQKKPSALKRGHPTLQNMNFYKFFSTLVGHFCLPGSGSGLRIRIRIHWPDWIRIQYGSGSAILVGILYGTGIGTMGQTIASSVFRLRTMLGGRGRLWRRLSAGWEPTWPMSLTRSSAHKWPVKPADAKPGAVYPIEALTLYSQVSLFNDKASRKNTNGGKSRTNPRILS